jgi:hypothetical protein
MRDDVRTLIEALLKPGKLGFWASLMLQPRYYRNVWHKYLNRLQLLEELDPMAVADITAHCKTSSMSPNCNGPGSEVLNASMLVDQWKVHRRGIPTLEIIGAGYYLAMEMFQDYTYGKSLRRRPSLYRKRSRKYSSPAIRKSQSSSYTPSLTALSTHYDATSMMRPEVVHLAGMC